MIRCPPQPVYAGHRVRTDAEAAAQGNEQRDGGPGVDPKGGRERAVPHAASSRHRCSGYDKHANRDMLFDTRSVSNARKVCLFRFDLCFGRRRDIFSDMVWLQLVGSIKL